MRPIDRARLVYEQEPCARTFEQDLGLHLAYHVVHSDNTLFLMGRAVPRNAPLELIRDPEHIFSPGECDCWWVYLAAGEVNSFLYYMPYPLPWLGWERGNQPRFYETNKVQRLWRSTFASSLSPS